MKKSLFFAILISHFLFLISHLDAQVASESEMLVPQKVGSSDMIPVFSDDVLEGDYEIEVESSSSMFRIASATLHNKDGKMTATLTMGGKGYSKLFLGTAEEASEANGVGEILWSQPLLQNDGHVEQSETSQDVVFEIPVSALNTPIECAAFSVKKKKWYGREILFDASTLPENALLVYPKTQQKIDLKDGNYLVKVSLSGGSGKASVKSPAKVSVKDGLATGKIEWSSPNYDYMKINRKRFNVDTKILEKGGNSTFTIPIFPVIADTTAMSQSHEILYFLEFDSESARKEKGKLSTDKLLLILAIWIIASLILIRIRVGRKKKKNYIKYR